jgi:hypothetical protein
MANGEVEIAVRIDFFRDGGSPVDSQEEEDRYVGSAMKDGLKTPIVPRVGEHVVGLGSLMRLFSRVTKVEHRLADIDSGPAGTDPLPPLTVVVFTSAWPGNDFEEQLLDDFASGGWTWDQVSPVVYRND